MIAFLHGFQNRCDHRPGFAKTRTVALQPGPHDRSFEYERELHGQLVDAWRIVGDQAGEVGHEQALDLFLVLSHRLAARIASGQFSRRIQEAAAAKPVFIGKFRVIAIGVEHRQQPAPGPAAFSSRFS